MNGRPLIHGHADPSLTSAIGRWARDRGLLIKAIGVAGKRATVAVSDHELSPARLVYVSRTRAAQKETGRRGLVINHDLDLMTPGTRAAFRGDAQRNLPHWPC